MVRQQPQLKIKGAIMLMKMFTCFKILKAKTERAERRNNQIYNHSESRKHHLQKLVKLIRHNTSVRGSNSDTEDLNDTI